MATIFKLSASKKGKIFPPIFLNTKSISCLTKTKKRQKHESLDFFKNEMVIISQRL